ncbi:MAG: MoxR family ATPase [Acidobacteria bacterium]|nr:MoxR family ATPase [Acidobacteriota bacterium]
MPERQLTIDEAAALGRRLETELGRTIVGQRAVLQEILIAFFAGGHCLLRGVPGLAKTLIIKTLARTVALSFNRIQVTPDLMPSDIVGAEVIEEDRSTGRREVRFMRGPVFAHILLADEINRTPPRTQAALLEAMQERQVTVGGVRYDLPAPQFVLATQNPIEQEGTYSLPEAQLDRFLLNVVIGYPTADEERQMLARTTAAPSALPDVVADGDDIAAVHRLVREIPAASNVVDYAARLVRATRPGEAETAAVVSKYVRWGAGPRAGQALLLCGKARALLEGRAAVSLDDVRALALPVLRHRVLVNFQAEAEGLDADAIVSRLLNEVSAQA